jgi:hypothetical protein
MIDEVSDTLGWDRKHTIKALNGRVSHGGKAQKRGSKPTYKEAEKLITEAKGSIRGSGSKGVNP